MDCTEIKVEMAEQGLLEALVITEEGDVAEAVTERGAVSSTDVITRSCSTDLALNKEDKHSGEDKNEENIASKMCLEEQQTEAEENQTEEVAVVEKDKPEDENSKEIENRNDGQNRGDNETIGQTHKVMRINEKPEKPGDTEEKNTQNDPQVDTKRLNSPEQQPEGTQRQEEDSKEVCKLPFEPFLVPWYHLW